MNSMPFRQLKSFLKILIGVQYENEFSGCPPGTRFFAGKPKIYGGSELSRRVSFSYLYPGRHVSQVRRRVIREYFRGIGFPHRFPLCTFSIPEGFGNW